MNYLTILFNRIPKNVYVGREILEQGVHDAVLTFNEGNIGRITVFKDLGLKDSGRYNVSTFVESQ